MSCFAKKIAVLQWQANRRVFTRWRGVLAFLLLISASGSMGTAEELPALTSLSDTALKYTVPDKPYVVLARGDVEAVIVNHEAVDDQVLPGHKAGYAGVASLMHARRQENLFVPQYAGLNFEHIHDGTTRERDVLFEPRRAPCELRVIDENTVELYQAATPTWKLESCQRYHMLPDGTLELTFECIPHAACFKNGYIGLFWASYIQQPESLDIQLRGRGEDEKVTVPLVGTSPSHGVQATHLALEDEREFAHDADFPLTLVFNKSDLRYARPYYYGVSHGMALVQIFRPQDQIRFSQSPSGGGRGNPAWDFQFFIENYQVGQRYQMVMRAQYLPFESYEETERQSRPHRRDLAKVPQPGEAKTGDGQGITGEKQKPAAEPGDGSGAKEQPGSEPLALEEPLPNQPGE